MWLIRVGVLDDHYHRSVLVPGESVDTDRTGPRLVNLRMTMDVGRALILYGSFVQGLEDSALAPVSADNRNEPPPATRTRQVDGGLRWAPSEKFALILGAFDIHKPYFNVDADNVYTQLGRLQYRGLETSLSYREGGLTMLLGGVFLQPRVTRLIPEPGATGDVPLGPVPLTMTANLDYAPSRWGPWAASLQWNRLSSASRPRTMGSTFQRLRLWPRVSDIIGPCVHAPGRCGSMASTLPTPVGSTCRTSTPCCPSRAGVSCSRWRPTNRSRAG